MRFWLLQKPFYLLQNTLFAAPKTCSKTASVNHITEDDFNRVSTNRENRENREFSGILGSLEILRENSGKLCSHQGKSTVTLLKGNESRGHAGSSFCERIFQIEWPLRGRGAPRCSPRLRSGGVGENPANAWHAGTMNHDTSYRPMLSGCFVTTRGSSVF